SEKVAGREQILTILQTNSCSIGQKSGEIWTGQTLLQPISFKSDRLLGVPSIIVLPLSMYIRRVRYRAGIGGGLALFPRRILSSAPDQHGFQG
ncbi:MAG TPA: hypothetical protein VF780_08210, partial [Nitrosospira sp.]